MNGFSDPQRNIEEFALKEGMRVADFGAGAGQYTFAAAKKVGENGRVYCIDVQKGLLDRVRGEAENLGLFNIDYIWADLEVLNGSKIKDGSLDASIVSNILFQIDDKLSFIKEVTRVTKPGGKILIIDWSDSFGGLGPSPEHVVSKDETRSLFESTGFIFERDVVAGDHHWGMIVRAKA